MAKPPDHETWTDEGPAVTPAFGTPVEGSPAAPATPAAVDSVRYEAGASIGSGSVGRLFVVFDRHLGREVACKELGVRTPVATGRFLREARVTARLEHPGIVPVHDLGRRPDGTWFYTMKLVRGRTLAEALAACGTLQERLALLPHFETICEAMAYAHAAGVVHRDLKPANVMVGAFGETQVLDWGLAKRRGDVDDPDEEASLSGAAHETAVGTVLGTPAYMSPEQATGALGEVDERSDVWSLGAILFEILCGRPPFEGGRGREVLAKARADAPPRVLSVQPDAPPELAAVADKALRRARAERYASAAELAAEIHAFQVGQRVRAYAYSARDLLRRFADQHRAVVGVVGLAACLLLSFASAAWIHVADERDRAVAAGAEARRFAAEALADRAVHAPGPAEAQLFAAHALLADASPRARGVLARHARAWQPRLAARWPVPEGCDELDLTLDGALLCIGPGGVTRLDRETGALSRLHTGPVSGAAVGPDGALVLDTEVSHGPGARQLAFSPDGATLAYALGNNSLWLEDLATGASARLGCTNTMRRPVWGPDGRVRAPCYDGTLQVAAPDGTLVSRAQVHDGGLTSASVAPDGRVAVGGLDRFARVLSAEGATLADLADHAGPVMDVAWSPDARWLATVTEDGAVALWSAADYRLAVRMPATGAPSTRALFSPDGRSLFVNTERGVLRWDLPAAEGGDTVTAPVGLSALAASPDGREVLIGGAGGFLVAVDAATGGVLRRLALGGEDRVVKAIAYAPDGRAFASTQLETVEVGGPGVSGRPPVAPGGRRLAAARGLLYGTSYLPELWSLDPRTGARSSPGLSAEWVGTTGDAVLAVARDGRAWLVGDTIVELPAFGDVGLVGLAGDDVAVETGSSLSLLDLRTRSPRWTVPHGHDHRIATGAFSPDGRYLATASWDRTLRLWERATGALVAVLEGHEHRVVGVAFAGPTTLVSVSWDHSARFWDLSELERDPAEIVRALEERSGVVLRDGRVALPQ